MVVNHGASAVVALEWQAARNRASQRMAKDGFENYLKSEVFAGHVPLAVGTGRYRERLRHVLAGCWVLCLAFTRSCLKDCCFRRHRRR
jgi:hypothetical protein